QQQRGKHHRVQAVDPLGVGEVEIQVADDGGQRDADDRAVEHDEPEPDRQHSQGDPLPPSGRGRLSRGELGRGCGWVVRSAHGGFLFTVRAGHSRPTCWATWIARERLSTSSLAKMWAMWLFTVASVTKSALAISRLPAPVASSRSTSTSRSVSLGSGL